MAEGFEAAYRHGEQDFCNLLAPVLLGAHYDTCDSLPSADDNAVAVAVLLEVAV